VNKVKILLGQ